MNQQQLYRWPKRMSKRLTGTTRHFQANVRLFSRGVVQAGSSQIRAIAGASGQPAQPARRRLQRFVAQKQSLDAFFVSWTRQVLEQVTSRQIVLIVDETDLGGRLRVMVVAVAFEGRCIPLAWRVYVANSRKDYPAGGQVALVTELLQWVKQGMPRGKRVLVLADRGIGTSPDLMRQIIALRWTFLFRVTRQSKLVLANGQAVTFYDQVQQPGERYAASGLVFKKRGRIAAHVRVLWGMKAKERWSLVTNDPTLTGWEYAQRMWIEEMFRDLKSHGWQVEAVLWTDPQRMSRLWVLLVVAYAWMLLLGAAREALGLTFPKRTLDDGSSRRYWSLFREGRQAYLAYAPP